MPSNPIQARVDVAVAKSADAARACATLIETQGLSAALAYSQTLNVVPPQCSLTANSANAERLRADAARKLQDSHWWAKLLKQRAIQEFEQEQRVQGKVTNYVSDELAEYMANSRR